MTTFEGIFVGTPAPRYSPVHRDGDTAVVELAADHPGFADPAYRRRRAELAGLALDWSPGQPSPTAPYTPAEHDLWRQVVSALAPLHEAHAADAFLAGRSRLALPVERIPQLAEVTDRLAPLSGFRYLPVAGLAPLRDFYQAFADSAFHSTQYLRHPSVPLYTPEPDVIHEVVGHATQLAVPMFAELYRSVGEATRRCHSLEALRFLSQVFWFTLEFGVVRERGRWKAYGAGILSSVGETSSFEQAVIRPVDWAAMGTAAYDITHYQPALFGFGSMAELDERLGAFFQSFDDRLHARLLRGDDSRRERT